VFVAAGLYNLAWGCYAIADPQWLFRLAGMPPSNTPEIFATLRHGDRPVRASFISTWRVRPSTLGPGRGGAGRQCSARSGSAGYWLPVAGRRRPPFALYLHDAWPTFR
jgi:hypothetical protein